MGLTKPFLILASIFGAVLVLGGVAWYTVWKYSLPFTVLPIITTLLGPTDLYTTYRSLTLATSRKASKRPLSSFPLAVNLALLILPAVLIALGAPNLSGAGKCQLKDTWQAWYSAHNKDAITGIQDALQCCGFGQVTEMPFPFYKGPKKGEKLPEVPANACSVTLGRNTACGPVWEGELKLAAALVVAAAAIALVTKFAFLIITLARPGFAERWFARQRYDKFDNTRAIEHLDDDYVEAEDDEVPPTHRTASDVPAIENGVNERTGLLLASSSNHDRNGSQDLMNDHGVWNRPSA
ncbi:hypothetical protein TWF506_003614 [Arthrobotrys conoides]|uniref:Tetraspanin Tsp3 n=1 Tax=Arthrobotrys conoides TaxID=74498 RepID=A0AAN8RQI2_9PEZI